MVTFRTSPKPYKPKRGSVLSRDYVETHKQPTVYYTSTHKGYGGYLGTETAHGKAYRAVETRFGQEIRLSHHVRPMNAPRVIQTLRRRAAKGDNESSFILNALSFDTFPKIVSMIEKRARDLAQKTVPYDPLRRPRHWVKRGRHLKDEIKITVSRGNMKKRVQDRVGHASRMANPSGNIFKADRSAFGFVVSVSSRKKYFTIQNYTKWYSHPAKDYHNIRKRLDGFHRYRTHSFIQHIENTAYNETIYKHFLRELTSRVIRYSNRYRRLHGVK